MSLLCQIQRAHLFAIFVHKEIPWGAFENFGVS